MHVKQDKHDENPGLRGHGLDFQNMTDEELWSCNAADIASVDSWTSDFDLLELGDSSLPRSNTFYIINLLKAQMRQQWIITRQNEQIIRLLRESTGKQPHAEE